MNENEFDHPELLDPDWQKNAEKEAWTDYRRQRRRAKRARRLTFTAVALVVVAGAGYGLYYWGSKTADNYDPHPNVGGEAGGAVTTTAPAPTELPSVGQVDLAHPFANTPAQNWAEGVAGITVPAPTQVGAFSAKQVNDALAQVEHAIAVAHLDPATLVSHSPDKYVALLAPFARPQLRQRPNPVLIYLQDGFHLLPVTPRMNGALTVRPGKTGELVVHASYVVAYAFDPGGHTIYGPGDIEPFVRVETDYVLRSGTTWETDSRGLSPEHYDSFYTQAACKPMDSGLLAPAYSDSALLTSSVSRQPGEFDPAQPMPTVGNCPD